MQRIYAWVFGVVFCSAAAATTYGQSSCLVYNYEDPYTGCTASASSAAGAVLAVIACDGPKFCGSSTDVLDGIDSDPATVGQTFTATVTFIASPGCGTTNTATGPSLPITAGSGSTCPVPASPKDPGPPSPTTPPETTTGDPIVATVGNKIQTTVDYQAPGPNALQFVRYYNSTPIASTAAYFGQGWTHTYSASVNAISSTVAAMRRPDGKSYTFTLTSGTWTPDADVSDRLVQLTSGWQYTVAANDSLETYDSYGNLSSIAYREGTVLTLTYATGAGAPTFPAQLLSVTDSFGRTISFSYQNNLIHTMTDPNGGVYTYAVGTGTNALSSVTYPDTYSRSYLYNESADTGGLNLPFALTGEIDENNSRYSTTWYGTAGASIQSQLAPGTSGNIGLYTLTNTLDGTGRIQSTSIVDPLGAKRGRTFTMTVGRNLVTGVTQPAANGSPTASKSYTYDANGNVAEVADLNGNVACAVYDLTRNLQTGRVEGLAPGSTCPSSISTYVPTAGTAQRKILTEWHSIWHLPIKRVEPLRITTWVYNGDGGVYCAPTAAKVGTNPIGVPCSMTIQPTTDATGGSGFGATANGTSRTWSYTYNSFGEVLTAVGPHRSGYTDITTYTYYTCTTGGQCGRVNTVTNQVGHVTTYTSYNAHGQPLTSTDPNGVVTTLTYDARLRLKSKQVGTETTSYTYYPTGLLNLVTLPDGSTVQSFYDAAHRLYKIVDGLGNYIVYTLDAMGNHTADNTYDSSGTLHRTHTRVFNALSELYQDINSANTAAVTTTLEYDGNGNVLSMDAPLNRNTTKLYDALNRVSQITDPMSGVTKPSYDGQNNPATVIDPRTLTTGYTYDGFGEITQLVSPDTGTTTYTYDTAGNIKTVTDARGEAGNYTFDDAKRVTKLVYSDQTINYTYDSGTNGIDRLTGASDANHSMAWAYDAHGRINSKSQTVASVTRTVSYTYTNADLTSLVTPSGQTITYGYTNHRVTSMAINGTTLLSVVTYDPFGPTTGWTWNNSTTDSRTYDEDGRVTQINTVSDPITYTYDNASRITGITDSTTSAYSWTLSYDGLDRLTQAAETGLTVGWTYDANGNRLSQKYASSTTYNISSTSNQITSTTGGLARTYAYDAAGNATSYGTSTLVYNDRGRLASDTVGGTSTTLLYNALGQMIEYTVGSTSTVLVYDESGHLLGEYSSSGALIHEYIWMGDIPVAELTPNGSSVSIYYIHTDQMNAPRKVTVPSTNTLAWRWDPHPFGEATPNQNPAGLGTFINNLRFPGQFYTYESGLNNNGARDYDPQTGRYVESDPIGLRGGGYSPYAYAGANPIVFADPSGLSQTAQNPAPPPAPDSTPSNSLSAAWSSFKSDVACIITCDWPGGSLDASLPSLAILPPIASVESVAAEGAVAGAESAATEFNYTQTVLNNVGSRPYINSPLLTQEIIDTGTGIADPGGIPGALRFDVPGSFNGSQGFYQLVIQPTTNTIFHFLFTSGP